MVLPLIRLNFITLSLVVNLLNGGREIATVLRDVLIYRLPQQLRIVLECLGVCGDWIRVV